jgi:WD40 repeat protein
LRFAWSDITEVTYCPGGYLFAATDKDRHRRVWNLATGEEKADLELETEGGVRDPFSHFSADGRYLMLERRSRATRQLLETEFWDIQAKRFARSLPGTYWVPIFDRGAKGLITSRSGDGQGRITLTVWRLEAGAEAPVPVLERRFRSEWPITLSPGPEFAATVERHGEGGNLLDITVWDVASGRAVGTRRHVLTRSHALQEVWFSDDGRFLFARSGDVEPEGWRWRLTAWEVAGGLPELWSFADEFRAPVSPDGKWVARISTAGVELFDTAGTLRGALRRPGDYNRVINAPFAGGMKASSVNATFSPDSRHVLVTGLSRQATGPLSAGWLPAWARRGSGQQPWTARLWRLDDAEEVAAFTGCLHAAFSADGSTLAVRHDDYKIRIWDVPPRKPIGAALAVSAAAWLVLVLSARVGAAWFARRR